MLQNVGFLAILSANYFNIKKCFKSKSFCLVFLWVVCYYRLFM